MKRAGFQVGARCIIATGFRPLVGNIVVKKRVDTVTKVTRKGFEIGKLKFDFNGHQKQKQQGLNSVFSVAMVVTKKQETDFIRARKARISEKKSLTSDIKKLNKELDAVEKQLDKIEKRNSLNQLRNQSKL